MLSVAFSAAMLGIEGYVVRVEADSAAGSPAFTIIGLARSSARRSTRAGTRGNIQLRLRISARQAFGESLSRGRTESRGRPSILRSRSRCWQSTSKSSAAHCANSSRSANSRLTVLFNLSAEFFRWCSARAMPASRNSSCPRATPTKPRSSRCRALCGRFAAVGRRRTCRLRERNGDARTQAPSLDSGDELVHGDLIDVRGQVGSEKGARDRRGRRS